MRKGDSAARTMGSKKTSHLVLCQVYHPCVLLAKKRYVGFMYESPKQATPTFDAKGIETVRRDTCGAVAKMMERTLRILFTSKDLSQVQTGSAIGDFLARCTHFLLLMFCLTAARHQRAPGTWREGASLAVRR